MALPDPKGLDFAFLKTGPFCDVDAKDSIDSQTLDYAHLKTGPFVGVPEEAAGSAAILASGFFMPPP